MTSKNKTLNKIHDSGIVAVVRTDSGEKAKKIAQAAKNGGINALEITMTVPGALEIIKELSKKYSKNEEIIIGAGSVLDEETARSSMLAGAEFIVSPTFDKDLVSICNKYDKLVATGAMTPTEVKDAMEAGSDIVKIFPAKLFGPDIVKAIKGPLPQAKLMPTGGINTDNVKEWIKAGSIAVGAGSAICGGADEGNYEKVTKQSSKFIKKIAEVRK